MAPFTVAVPSRGTYHHHVVVRRRRRRWNDAGPYAGNEAYEGEQFGRDFLSNKSINAIPLRRGAARTDPGDRIPISIQPHLMNSHHFEHIPIMSYNLRYFDCGPFARSFWRKTGQH